ncbi:MAG: PilZ domain-containing protein [Nitrosomonas sp.]|nr:PilZ domain-containing protein [Nitrosomonas sp.]MDP1950365.1 PilZ domain-containing protein [Nitrosomonas sp.]
MLDYKRKEERICCELRVTIGEAWGIAHNISASGIYFETDLELTLGSRIDFMIKYDTPGGGIKLNCEGSVVRIEQRSNRLGVAARIIESKFNAASA